MELKRKILTKTIKVLSNLQLSIVMLLIISLVSIIGTIIEQDKSIEFYQENYPINNNLISNLFSWKIIIALNINNIFQSWWFIALIVFFSATIIACTISRQLPILNLSKQLKFYNNLKSYLYKDKKNKILSNYLINLNNNFFSIFQTKNQIYAYKGILGRLSPIIVHISMILILIGGSIGFFEGFVSQEMVPKGEFFHIQNMISFGLFSKTPANLSFRLNNFWIEYNSDSSINQFYSDITVYKDDIEVSQKVISVNNPLNYKEIDIYQTDWNINGIRLEINKKVIQLPMNKFITEQKEKMWLNSINSGNSKITLTTNQLNNKLNIYNSEGQLLQSVKIDEEFIIGGITYKVLELLVSSGLQIKTDPGIPIVYVGFLTLMISSLSSYISFSQIWIIKNDNTILLNGNTNRSILEFENNFSNFIKNSINYQKDTQI
uniref:c-type cytochrome biogenensis protein n=1 Tax=Porphyridium aerugineum TaxID=2792 RepID=UPI001FCE01EA|nr:c-type cytochrome biogenensis protein [Porphyridium aerugineum]UNJ17944.1 c-type cytochrome biogenensis protein [Porphyridium aerugineum]